MQPTRTYRSLACFMALAMLLLATGADAVTASGAIPLSSVTSITPARAVTDRERLWSDGCMAYESVSVPRHCVYGVTTSKKIVALVGDSHAGQLFPAVERIAKAQGWRLEVFVKVSCAFIDMKVWNIALGRVYTECATWNANVVRPGRRSKSISSKADFQSHPQSPPPRPTTRSAARGRRSPGRSGSCTAG